MKPIIKLLAGLSPFILVLMFLFTDSPGYLVNGIFTPADAVEMVYVVDGTYYARDAVEAAVSWKYYVAFTCFVGMLASCLYCVFEALEELLWA